MDPKNPRSGPTGPRTVIGKKNSSKNSKTHGVFCKDFAPSEDHLRRRLSAGIAKELGANTLLKAEICRQIAFNFIERRRIEEYLNSETQKATAQEAHRQLSAAIAPKSLAITVSSSGADTSLSRMRASFVGSVLTELKDDIDKGARCPREVSQILKEVYRGSVTAIAEAMIALCEEADVESRRSAKDKDTGEERQDWRARLRGLLGNEIAAMEKIGNFEKALEENADIQLSVLPSQEVLDKVDRLRASNGRELVRLFSLLKALE